MDGLSERDQLLEKINASSFAQDLGIERLVDLLEDTALWNIFNTDISTIIDLPPNPDKIGGGSIYETNGHKILALVSDVDRYEDLYLENEYRKEGCEYWFLLQGIKSEIISAFDRGDVYASFQEELKNIDFSSQEDIMKFIDKMIDWRSCDTGYRMLVDAIYVFGDNGFPLLIDKPEQLLEPNDRMHTIKRMNAILSSFLMNSYDNLLDKDQFFNYMVYNILYHWDNFFGRDINQRESTAHRRSMINAQ